MTDRTERLSGNEETLPLLRDPEANLNAARKGSFSYFADLVQEPISGLTKILLFIVIALLLVSSVFIGLFAGAHQKLDAGRRGDVGGNTTDTVCLEPHCIILSASILSSLDTTQDPCENFYEFANGGWLKAHPLPADKSSYGNFDVAAQQNQQVIREILESTSPTTDPVDEQVLTKLRDFYGSCLNEDRIDDVGALPLLQLVRTIKRLYREKRGLTAAIAFLHSKGIESLFSLAVEGDIGVDPNYMVPWFSQPGFGLPSKEYYKEKSTLEIYTEVIERLLTALDVEDEAEAEEFSRSALTMNGEPNFKPFWIRDPARTRKMKSLANDIVNFESRLAEASLDFATLQDPIVTYNPKPLRNLTAALPQIHFPTYFSTFNLRKFPDRVVVTYPEYLYSLSAILKSTPADVLEGYLVARAALKMSPFLSKATEAWQAQRYLLETLTGLKKGEVGDRAEYCTSFVEEKMGYAVGRYFVNATLMEKSKTKGFKIVENIVKAFKASLNGIDWMDKESAQAAAEKADNLHIKVGYPLSPNTSDPRSIALYYRELGVDKFSFFDNALSAASSETYKLWQQLGNQRDPEIWLLYPSAVHAYHHPPANEIVLPAGILRPPFFAYEWPNYLSYAAFGQAADHELTHAFDSAGHYYNQNGKLKQWWTNSTNEAYQIKQKCIEDQFSAYTIDDGNGGKVHVNGELTSGENIGDTGIIQAYRAWKAQYQTSLEAGDEYLLPGLNYTRDQMFFISFALIWAKSIKPAAAVRDVRSDPHSPHRYRVDGTISNVPEFAEAFKCSKTAKLNPPREKQCIFWS